MPGTESSESTTDKDVQEQLWDDKKVPVERIKGYAYHLVIMDKKTTSELQLMALFSTQEDSSKASTCDVPGIK